MTHATDPKERPQVAPEVMWWLTLSVFADQCHECLTDFAKGDPCVWNSTLVEKLCEECASQRGIIPELSKRFRDERFVSKRPLSREEIRDVACTRCGALPGERCLGARGKRRKANHFERMQAAQKAAKGA